MRDSTDAGASGGWQSGRMTPREDAAAATTVAERADGRRSDSWTQTYRLAHCEGYSVDSPAGHLGYVEAVMTTRREGDPVALRIRTRDSGGRDVVLVPIDCVGELFASREQVVLRDVTVDVGKRRTVMAEAETQFKAERGDVLVVHGHAVGRLERSGEILEVLGEPGHEHYLVRWDETHESLVYPSSDVSIRRRER